MPSSGRQFPKLFHNEILEMTEKTTLMIDASRLWPRVRNVVMVTMENSFVSCPTLGLKMHTEILTYVLYVLAMYLYIKLHFTYLFL